MHSAWVTVAIIVTPVALVAHAEDWPDPSSTASDRLCAARLCSRWWADPAAAARCLDRYSDMVSEQLANPYRKEQRASQPRTCVGGSAEPCIHSEPIAIGRLLGIYNALSGARAKAEMESGTQAPRELRVQWERLAWCQEHYQPGPGASSYQDVLECYDPMAAKGIGGPDPPSYVPPFQRRFGQLFGESLPHGLCPERAPYRPE